MKKETYQTIALIIATFLLMFSDNLFCQAFIAPGISNKGAMVQMGYLSNKTEISASYVVPFTKNTNARIVSLQAGCKIDISHNVVNNYSIMPYAGYGYLRYKDFAAYENDPTGKSAIVNVSEYKPLIGLQVGKDSHAGNVYLYGQYVKTFYVGIGLKVYFSKL